jgi:hypothetical protein
MKHQIKPLFKSLIWLWIGDLMALSSLYDHRACSRLGVKMFAHNLPIHYITDHLSP